MKVSTLSMHYLEVILWFSVLIVLITEVDCNNCFIGKRYSMYVCSYIINLLLLCSADLINPCTINGLVQLTQKGSMASENRLAIA